MADWGVFYRKLEIFPHPNADSLEIARAGNYQFVVRKGEYKEGEGAFVIPEKSILSGALREKYQDYLAGSEKNRVKAVKLRGELSMGILMSPKVMFELFGPKQLAMVVQSNVDYSERFGVTKYEPPIPLELAGQVSPVPGGSYSKHDVEQFSVYRDELAPEDRVVITEKIHGSQAAYTLTSQGDFFVTSKGLFDKHLMLKESETNAYWRAGNKVDIRERMEAFQKEVEAFTGERHTVQVFGEVVPVQGGNWTYGFKEPELLVFDVRYDGKSLNFSAEGPSIPAYFVELWVPILHLGPLGEVDLQALCKGNEQVSGKEMHIREGIVVRPETMRFAKDGTRVFLKVINPVYSKKETGEEVN